MVRLKKLAVEGLFSYAARQEIEFSDRTVIVGPNNAGKSNLFRAVNMLADALRHDLHLPVSKMSQSGGDPRIEAEISLSQCEVDILVDFFSCGKMKDEDPKAQEIFEPNLEKLGRYLDNVTVKIGWKRMPDGTGGNMNAAVVFPECGFGFKAGSRGFSLQVVRADGTPGDQSSHASFNEFMNAILESDDPKNESELFLRSKFVTHHSVQFDRHGMADDPPAKLQDLMFNLNLNKSSGSVSLIQVIATMLARRIVHATENRNLIRDDVEELERLALEDQEGSAAEYDRALLDTFRADSMAPADELKPDGSNMARFLFALKNSPDFSSVERYNKIKSRFERLFEDPKLSIEPIEERRIITKAGGGEPFPDRRVMIVDEASSKHLPLEQAGAGVRNVLYLLAAVHGTKESIVMLDEPGINLHPTILHGVMDNVYKQDSGNQIFVITHSVDLLRYEMSRNSHVAHIGNAGGQSRICQDAYKTIKLKKEPREVAHVIDPAVFFARRVILVEGESDRAMLDISGYMAVKDPKYNLPLNNIAVVGVGSKYNFETYRKLLDECGISWRILADGDAKDVFEHDPVSWVCKDGVEGSGPIYLIKGDLEEFMEAMDPDICRQSKKRSKVATALEYEKLMIEKNPDCAPPPIVKFLDRCVE